MKIKSLILILAILFAGAASAQSKKAEVIKIKTSAECEMCKKKLETELAFEKGIKFCKVDLDSKVASITYSPDKTSPEKIKNAISKIGYDADEVKADSVAYEQLPECCKKGGHPK